MPSGSGCSVCAKFIQISAPVQRGNSGGPVVDLSGRVVGIVTSKLDAEELVHIVAQAFGTLGQPAAQAA